tara:strand:+ start:1745 stop:1972 length:228 start_codon:yes stop_codon:yes gene_type:complete
LKVKELIKALKKLDPEMLVYTEDEYNLYTPAVFVEESLFVTDGDNNEWPAEQDDIDAGEFGHLEIKETNKRVWII